MDKKKTVIKAIIMAVIYVSGLFLFTFCLRKVNTINQEAWMWAVLSNLGLFMHSIAIFSK